MKKMKKKVVYKYESSGFIVHPKWTSSGRYEASYGKNHNKTVKDFSSLKAAKEYLRKRNVTSGMYDNSYGDIQGFITKVKSKRIITKKPIDINAMLGW